MEWRGWQVRDVAHRTRKQLKSAARPHGPEPRPDTAGPTTVACDAQPGMRWARQHLPMQPLNGLNERVCRSARALASSICLMFRMRYQMTVAP